MESLYALYQSLKYVARFDIPGAIVECGVYKGASAMLAGSLFVRLGHLERTLYLYDTFAGMTPADDRDVQRASGSTAAQLLSARGLGEWSKWANATLDEVKQNVRVTGYPEDQVVFVVGRVQDTIPATVPDRIAILRLDTDWYASTYHELQHLYQRLSPGGVLIVDDYGHWEGAQRATEDYLVQRNVRILLHRVDYTVRIGIKSD